MSSKDTQFKKGQKRPSNAGRKKGVKNKVTVHKDIAIQLKEQHIQIFNMLFTEVDFDKLEREVTGEKRLSVYAKGRIICFIKAVNRGDYRAISVLEEVYLEKPSQRITIDNGDIETPLFKIRRIDDKPNGNPD